MGSIVYISPQEQWFVMEEHDKTYIIDVGEIDDYPYPERILLRINKSFYKRFESGELIVKKVQRSFEVYDKEGKELGIVDWDKHCIREIKRESQCKKQTVGKGEDNDCIERDDLR